MNATRRWEESATICQSPGVHKAMKAWPVRSHVNVMTHGIHSEGRPLKAATIEVFILHIKAQIFTSSKSAATNESQ